METTATSATITVIYRLIEGLHVFTSEDVYGLYIANRDPERAYQDLVPSIERLLEMNEGLRCSVRPVTSLRELLDRQKGYQPSISDPAFLARRQFVVDYCN